MGKEERIRIGILIAVFTVGGVLANWGGGSAGVAITTPLSAQFEEIGAYRRTLSHKIDQDIYDFLKLDDYTFAEFESGVKNVGLYIGFYHTAEKASANHSPLVCFPSQGWIVSKPQVETLTIDGRDLNYAWITAQLGDRRELIYYWYQSYLNSTPRTFTKKLYTLYNKLFTGEELNAFVRITVPLTGKGEIGQARQVGQDFLNSFYPEFIAYINQNDGKGA